MVFQLEKRKKERKKEKTVFPFVSTTGLQLQDSCKQQQQQQQQKGSKRTPLKQFLAVILNMKYV